MHYFTQPLVYRRLLMRGISLYLQSRLHQCIKKLDWCGVWSHRISFQLGEPNRKQNFVLCQVQLLKIDSPMLGRQLQFKHASNFLIERTSHLSFSVDISCIPSSKSTLFCDGIHSSENSSTILAYSVECKPLITQRDLAYVSCACIRPLNRSWPWIWEKNKSRPASCIGLLNDSATAV